MSAEAAAREAIVTLGKSLYDRGLVHGATGNISVRVESGTLVTPTGKSLGTLDPVDIALVGDDGTLIGGGPKPSKEAFLHLACYARRPQDRAVVHTHSTHCVALSCLESISGDDPLPPITAYQVMRVGKLALLPYFRPGDRALADAMAQVSADRRVVLMAHHGPIASGTDLSAAADAIEELEETAKLILLLGNKAFRTLDADQIADLNAHFPS